MFVERLRDLLAEPFLELRTSGEDIDCPRQLRQPDHPALPGQIGDVRLTEEGQQVMFAHAAELDASDQDRLVRLVGEGPPQVPLGGGADTGKYFAVGPGDAPGCVSQTLAVGVLADRQENLANRSFDPREIESIGQRPCGLPGAMLCLGGSDVARAATIPGGEHISKLACVCFRRFFDGE